VTPGVQLYAHFDLPCGLTVSALNTERLLRARGAAVGRHSVALREQWVDGATDGDVNLLHINPVDVVRFMMWPHADPRFEDRLNLCAPFWELGRLPDFWVPVLESMDAVLAPTSFVGDAVLAAVPDARVIRLPQAVTVPDNVQPDRARFGIPDDVFVFGTSFAAEAVLDRKNPEATIAAFLRAFPDERDVVLVVRASPTAAADPVAVWEKLEAAAHGDPRVHVLRGRLDYAGILSLYATLDVYVSLHRAEGLGLGMMESMSLGTPVIATGWSGSMDFMTDDNSLPVSYAMTPVAVGPDSPYSVGSIGFVGEWAEPSIEDAAAKMQHLYADRELTRRLSATALEDMDSRRREVERAAFVDEITGLLTASPLPGKERRAAQLRSIESVQRRRGLYMRPYLKARATGGKLLRATGLRP